MWETIQPGVGWMDKDWRKWKNDHLRCASPIPPPTGTDSIGGVTCPPNSANEICMEAIPLSPWPHWLAQEWACDAEWANEIFTEVSGEKGGRNCVVKGEIVAATLNMRWDDREEPFWQRLSLRIKIEHKVSSTSEFFSYVNLWIFFFVLSVRYITHTKKRA